MKKILLSSILTISLIFPLIALGQTDQIENIPEDVQILGPGGLLDTIANYLFSILLLVGVIFLIVSGFFFITSQGDLQKYDTAKKMVLYAIIGLLVGFLAKGIVMLIDTVVRSSY